MKRLTANRPIQYMGRTYDRGETIPAHDGKMVDAWLKAGSAKWENTEPQEAAQEKDTQGTIDPMAACVLQVLDGLGVKITDDAGEFCGEAELAARITAAVMPEGWNPEAAPAQGVEAITAHLDAATLAKLKTEDLEKLAADMGADLSGAKTNTERAEMIAAVEVLIPKSGSAQ